MSNLKPGDWVIISVKKKPYTHIIKIIKIIQETETDYAIIESIDKEVILDGKFLKIELWQPKLGEWCWFYSKHTNIAPVLRKFEYKHNNSFYTNDEMIFTGCEPFIGNLPNFIKDTHGTKQT